MSGPQLGASASLEFTVSHDDTAIALGSGDFPVLATPRLLAWLEAVCVHVLDLAPDRTSVGTRVEIEHVGAAAVGGRIAVTASIAYVDGRLIRFDVVAERIASPANPDGTVVRLAQGSLTRVIVDRARFMARLT